MPNKKTSPQVAKLGSQAMRGKPITSKEKKTLGASVVSQAKGKPKKSKSK